MDKQKGFLILTYFVSKLLRCDKIVDKKAQLIMNWKDILLYDVLLEAKDKIVSVFWLCLLTLCMEILVHEVKTLLNDKLNVPTTTNPPLLVDLDYKNESQSRQSQLPQ